MSASKMVYHFHHHHHTHTHAYIHNVLWKWISMPFIFFRSTGVTVILLYFQRHCVNESSKLSCHSNQPHSHSTPSLTHSSHSLLSLTPLTHSPLSLTSSFKETQPPQIVNSLTVILLLSELFCF